MKKEYLIKICERLIDISEELIKLAYLGMEGEYTSPDGEFKIRWKTIGWDYKESVPLLSGEIEFDRKLLELAVRKFWNFIVERDFPYGLRNFSELYGLPVEQVVDVSKVEDMINRYAICRFTTFLESGYYDVEAERIKAEVSKEVAKRLFEDIERILKEKGDESALARFEKDKKRIYEILESGVEMAARVINNTIYWEVRGALKNLAYSVRDYVWEIETLEKKLKRRKLL